MKFLKTTLFCLLFSFSAFAKDSTAVEFKRFAIGIHVSPDNCYRKLTLVNSNSLTSYLIDYRNTNEIPDIGYTAGPDLSFYFKKKFSLSLGINFSQKGYKTYPIDLTTAANPYVGVGKVVFRYNYNYIEIPLKANFILGKKKIRFLVSAGINSAFMMNETTITKYQYTDGTKENKKGKPNYIYNPFNLFLTGSIGLDLKLGKSMGLKTAPTYSYGLLQTINADITEHLWSAGLDLGCYIGF